MGRPDYAVKCFTEALAIEEDFETMGYLSQLYIQTGETEKARELLEKMAIMEPHVTNTFLTLANVCFIQEDYKAMEEAASKAIAIEKGNAVAHYLLGKARKGQEEEAEADYQLVTEVNPFNEQAYLYLGQLFINQKKLTEAISLFDEAIELNPNFAEAYKERGRAKLLNGDKDGSVEDMKRSLELNPKDEASLNGEFKNLGPKQEALPGIF